MCSFKYFDEDLSYYVGVHANELYPGIPVRSKPFKLNSWQPLCAGIDTETGEFRMIR